MMNKLTYIFILFLIPFISAGSLNMHFVDLTSMSSVEGVSVDLYDYNTNILLSTHNSDVNGVLTIDDLEGEYTLRASKDGYSNVKITQVMNGADVDLGDQFMVSFSKVNVEISNASGPVTNAVVTIQETVDSISDVFEGSNGVLEVPAGSYTIFVYAPNHVQKSFPINLAPGEVVNKVYVMEYSNETLFPTVVNVEVDLDKSSVNAGEEVIVSAKAIYNNGLEYDVTSSAQWNIPDVGEVYNNEIVTQVRGTHTITATFLGKTGTSTLNVANGEVESLTLTASKTSVVVKEKSIITCNLRDVYANVFTSSADVTCTTTCGTLNGNEFSSNSVCTATILCVYNANNSINSTVTVKVNEEDSGGSSSGSSGSTKTTTTTTTTSTTTTTTVKPVVEEKVEEELTTIKFVLPDEVVEGGLIEIVVTDINGDPVEGIEITVMDPNKDKFTLSSDSNGLISFEANLFGNYFLYSEDYTIAGTRVIYVESLMPDLSELNTTPVIINAEPIIPQKRDVNETNTEDTRASVFDVLTATISGEMSIVDALKATVHLWILIAIVLISAAIFFVVYTYVIGKSISDDENNSKPDNVQMEKVSVKVSETIVPPAVDQPITETESELEEKLRKLRELKRNL